MKLQPLPFLLSLSALASALPIWPQGPIVSDDETLMDRRDLYRVEILEEHSSPWTSTLVAKITKYALDAIPGCASSSSSLTDAPHRAVADSEGDVEVLALSDGDGAVEATTRHRGSGGSSAPGGHHISLLGLRDRLAWTVLVLGVILTAGCSLLRGRYVTSIQDAGRGTTLEVDSSEKSSQRDAKKEEETVES